MKRSSLLLVFALGLTVTANCLGAWETYDDHSGAGAYGACDATKWVNQGSWQDFWGRHPDDQNLQYAKGAVNSTNRYLESVRTFSGSEFQIAWDSDAYQLWDLGNYAYGFAFGSAAGNVSVAQNVHHVGTQRGAIAINDTVAGATNYISGDRMPMYHYMAVIKDGSVALSIYTYGQGKAPADYTSANLLETVTATGTASISGQVNKLYFYQDYNPLTGAGAGFYTNYFTRLGTVYVNEIPEPATICLMASGLLVYLRKKI